VGGHYFKFVYGFDPAWTFLFIGNSVASGNDKRARLVGRVYIFNRTRWLNAVGSHQCGEKITDGLLEAASLVAEEPNGCEQLISGPLKEIEASLMSSAVYVVSCDIHRNGIVRIKEEARADGILFTPAVTESARPIDESATRYFCNQA